MSVTQASQLNPAGLAFHQVLKERFKELGAAIHHLDLSFQELFRNMLENEKKRPIGGQVLLCQQAHVRVMRIFCEMAKQESVYPVLKVNALHKLYQSRKKTRKPSTRNQDSS